MYVYCVGHFCICLRNQHQGTIDKIFSRNGLSFCTVDAGEKVLVEITEASRENMELEEGRTVYCLFKSAALKIFWKKLVAYLSEVQKIGCLWRKKPWFLRLKSLESRKPCLLLQPLNERGVQWGNEKIRNRWWEHQLSFGKIGNTGRLTRGIKNFEKKASKIWSKRKDVYLCRRFHRKQSS